MDEKKANILVVDDEGVMRNLLSDVLGDVGHNVVAAASGDEAIELAKQTEFEIVITDLRMPGMSGIEVLKKVKELHSDACVIVITAYTSIESAVEAMKEGAYDYIAKPFNLDEIKLIVSRAIERHHLFHEAKEKEHYKTLSIRDNLTGLYNHRHFHDAIQQELKRAERYSQPMSLLLIDVDDFKKYNDTYGHLAGDEVLYELSAILNSAARKTDIVARYGGEEFAIIMPQTDRKDASILARRIRAMVEHEEFLKSHAKAGNHVTVSIGLATFPHDATDKKSLIEKTDQALYRAKNLGKNRVCFFEEK